MINTVQNSSCMGTASDFEQVCLKKAGGVTQYGRGSGEALPIVSILCRPEVETAGLAVFPASV